MWIMLPQIHSNVIHHQCLKGKLNIFFKPHLTFLEQVKRLFSEMKIHMQLKIQYLIYLELYPAIGSECNYQFGNIRMLPMQPKLTTSRLIFLNRLFLDLSIDLGRDVVVVFRLQY